MELLYLQDTQVKLLNQLTVIIFSRERHKELVKCLNYWENLGVRCMVLDNSSIALKNSSQNLDSVYFHCAGLNLAERSLIASENISTKYSIICPDDERFLPESLTSMISLLENENEFKSQIEKDKLVDLVNTIAAKRKNIEIYSEIKRPFLSDKYFKYALQRLIFSKSTPIKINQVLTRIKDQGIDYNLTEVNFAVNSMLSK